MVQESILKFITPKSISTKKRKNKIGFIGLGTMGFPMAGHLAHAGYEIIVFNRTPSKSEKFKKIFSNYKVFVANSLKDVSKFSDIIISCVSNDLDVENITAGTSGVFKSMKKNSIFIDHSTISARVSIKTFKIAEEKKLIFFDAPVSGGNLGAKNGLLSVMCGGSFEYFRKIKPIIDTYSKKTEFMGKAGNGQLTKMVNQICIAGLLQGLAEGLNFGIEKNLDMRKVLSVIGEGAAQSWQLQNRGQTMLKDKYDFGFAVSLMCKDLDILLNEANNKNISLPVTKMVSKFYNELNDSGKGSLDTSALLLRMQKK